MTLDDARFTSWTQVMSTNSQGAQAQLVVAGDVLYIGGATTNTTANNQYLTVVSVNGATITFKAGVNFAPQNGQTVLIAPVVTGTDESTISSTVGLTQVSFSNSNGQGVITLGSGVWSGYAVGQGIFIGSNTDANANGAAFSASAANPYYVIAGISGNKLTVTRSLAAEASALVNLAPVKIVANNLSTLDVTAGDNVVNFAEAGGFGTIALANGASWTGYTVGQGIFIGSAQHDPNTNGNGLTFSNSAPNPYYVISAINGDTISFIGNVTSETGVTVTVLPVAVSVTNQSTLSNPSVGAVSVAFGNNGGNGTITLSSGSWSGYVAGQGVFIGSATDGNANGVTFDATATKPYYVIVSVSGSVLTVKGNLTAEASANVDVAPVTISTTNQSAVVPLTAGTQTVNFSNSAGKGVITLASGAAWVGYSVGEGVFIGAANNTDGNGGVFNAGAANAYDTITAINGDQMTVSNLFATPATGVSVNLAPVNVNGAQSTLSDVTTGARTINFSNVSTTTGGVTSVNGTLTLADNSDWVGYAVGQGVFVGSLTDANANGATFSASAANGYYTIVGVNGSTLTVQGAISTPETGASVNVAPVTVTTSDHSALAPVATGSQTVAFGANTITLSSGSWTGYTVGQGVFVGSATDVNKNGGAAFNAGAANPYYTITAISGSTLTVSANLTVEASATVTLAPVTVVVIDKSVLAPTLVMATVDFAANATDGVTTLTSTSGWANYSVGQGVFVGSATDPNANGATFNASATKPYYVITAISGNVLTVAGVLTNETAATVSVSPVSIKVAESSTASAPVSQSITFAQSGRSTGRWCERAHQHGGLGRLRGRPGRVRRFGVRRQRQRRHFQRQRGESVLRDHRDQRQNADRGRQSHRGTGRDGQRGARRHLGRQHEHAGRLSDARRRHLRDGGRGHEHVHQQRGLERLHRRAGSVRRFFKRRER